MILISMYPDPECTTVMGTTNTTEAWTTQLAAHVRGRPNVGRQKRVYYFCLSPCWKTVQAMTFVNEQYSKHDQTLKYLATLDHIWRMP